MIAKKVSRDRLDAQLLLPCQTPAALRAWAEVFLGLKVPAAPVCPEHDAPLAYLAHAYFEPTADLVVWAPRGGGKTRLGAVATLLDLLHKPGVGVRILGGSAEQSLRMWEHLMPDVRRVAGGLLVGRARARRIELVGGSVAAVLTQSQRAVRGLRVQKLRCDEVELFDADVWEAAQLITRSMKTKPAGTAPQAARGAEVRGVVEALSTLHTPYGLMSRIVDAAVTNGTRVIRWCLLEVLERCPPERECGSCPLWDDCRGVAKTKCDGYVRIDDAIAMKRRVGEETWQAEMLCRRPSVRGCVFAGFDLLTHVTEELPNANFQLPHRNAIAERDDVSRTSFGNRHSEVGNSPSLSLAIDFGYANPFVCLFIVTTSDGVTHVVDEYVQRQRTVEEHIAAIGGRGWPVGRGTVVYCDPAGNGRSDQTGRSSVDSLRAAGYIVRTRPSRIVDGLEWIRAALRPAQGPPRLFIHRRCQRLIKALRTYRYPEGGGEIPIKDGENDHSIDALRYHFIHQQVAAGLKGGRAY
jgi:hypothetical protein